MGKRERERPKLRWNDIVTQDLTDVMSKGRGGGKAEQKQKCRIPWEKLNIKKTASYAERTRYG